jgi:DNA replication protein DnaC
MKTIKKRLKKFKLAGINNGIKERLEYANQEQISYTEFLEILLEDEENSRNNNSYKKRYKKAKFPMHKTIEEFDYSFQPSIDKRILNDCLTCNFIEQKNNIIFIGNPGTGKTHLSISIGVRALRKGYKVLFTKVSDMLNELHMSKADNSYYKKLKYYTKVDLLILDELGFKKIPDYSANDFFEVISRRYEKGAVIITTNKTFERWEEIFSDNVLTSAIIDRIVHHSKIFKINGQSYRKKDLKRSKNFKR